MQGFLYRSTCDLAARGVSSISGYPVLLEQSRGLIWLWARDILPYPRAKLSVSSAAEMNKAEGRQNCRQKIWVRSPAVSSSESYTSRATIPLQTLIGAARDRGLAIALGSPSTFDKLRKLGERCEQPFAFCYLEDRLSSPGRSESKIVG